ncbi:hypothetical protein J3F83DRAFT_728457 [Trichoderma novae-zelandiae]
MSCYTPTMQLSLTFLHPYRYTHTTCTLLTHSGSLPFLSACFFWPRASYQPVHDDEANEGSNSHKAISSIFWPTCYIVEPAVPVVQYRQAQFRGILLSKGSFKIKAGASSRPGK